MEQIANLFSTTLASSYTAGATTISVTSATGAPSDGTFSLAILDASSGAVLLIFRVTSIAGTTFTGAAEGPDANASSASVVVGTIFSLASMSQLMAEMNQAGPLSSLPAAAYTGARYLATDSAVDEYRWNGSSWDGFVAGIKCNLPQAATFTQDAISSNGTVVSFGALNGVLALVGYSNGSDNLIAKCTTYPTAPFTRTLRFRSTTANSSNANSVGLVLYNSTSDKGLLFGWGVRSAILNATSLSYNTVTSPGISFYNYSGWASFPAQRGGLFHIRFVDDGTNRFIELSDDGVNFHMIWTESNTAFIAPSHIGFGMETFGSSTKNDILSIYDFSS